MSQENLPSYIVSPCTDAVAPDLLTNSYRKLVASAQISPCRVFTALYNIWKLTVASIQQAGSIKAERQAQAGFRPTAILAEEEMLQQ